MPLAFPNQWNEEPMIGSYDPYANPNTLIDPLSNGGYSNPFMIPNNGGSNVIGSTNYDPNITGLDPSTVPSTHQPFDPNAISSGGQFPSAIPLPVNGTTALLGSVLLSGGIPNPFGGGASPSQIVNRVGDIASNPVGTTTQTINNVGNQVGGIGNGEGDGSNIPLPVGGGGSSGGSTSTGHWPSSNHGQGGNTVIIPAGAMGGAAGDNPNNTSIFPSMGNNHDSGNTIPPPTTGLPEQPNTPIIPTPTPTIPTTPTTGGGPTLPPIIPIPTPTPTTMPTGTPPDPRNLFNEGNIGTDAYNRLSGGIGGNYNNNAGGYGRTDLNNLGGLFGLQGNPFLGDVNAAASQVANAQTGAAMRGFTNNLAGSGGDLLSLLKQYNPNQYAGLDTANRMASSGQGTLGGDLQSMAQQQLALGSGLSSAQIRDSQQASRAGDSARGLIMGPNSVGNEVLTQDRYGQQLLAQRQNFASGVNQNLTGNALQNAQLQSQAAFNPSQYFGNATGNYGTNSQINAMGTGFSSGANSNGYVQALANPFNNYGNDVNGSNFNAANAQYISGQNNAAALAAGRNIQATNYTDMFMNALYGIGTQNGWFRPTAGANSNSGHYPTLPGGLSLDGLLGPG